MTDHDTSAQTSVELIRAVATRLFSERGYAGTTMREIAERVGMLPGSLYAHISSKEELLRGIAQAGIDRFLTVRAELGRSLPVDERMRVAVRAHVRVVAENPPRSRVVFHEWRFLSSQGQQEIIRKRERYEAIFIRLVKEGMEVGVFAPDRDPRIAVMGILGALNWTPEWLRRDGARTPADIAEELAHIVLSGLLQ